MHKVEHRVLYADTDAGQVVYYANYLRWFESGRVELLKTLGISYNEVERSGIIVPVVEVHCNYLSPAKYDDVVVIETVISEIKEKIIRFEYKIYRKKDMKLLVTGHTINVFVDREKMQSMYIPDELRGKLKTG